MSRRRPAGAAPFTAIWNVASVLLACAAGLLFAAGYSIAGGIAFALCAGGYAFRRRTARS